ncbi:hypothetical protein SAMN05428997_14414 [Bosea sp. CRIB-10]|uniref:hypothetical protein n=1 Tax=Bosea sp. CRIB-10 TaxID=378404 RepID=UPI0008E8C360|nr:hypothetical protein [Bosea sp. CRIB-10]SFD71117.1 hypothetical protein SAMN05428997_14414 [Bosea sp. CRIB-10]
MPNPCRRPKRQNCSIAAGSPRSFIPQRTVNCTDKAKLIVGYHKNFLDALEATQKQMPSDAKPEDAKPDDVPVKQSDSLGTVAATTSGAALASLLAAVQNPWALAAFVLTMVAGGVGLWLAITGAPDDQQEQGDMPRFSLIAIAFAGTLALFLRRLPQRRIDGERLALTKVAQKNTEAANTAREMEPDGALWSRDPACILPAPWRR